MKPFILMFMLAISSGCSWIAVDRYYEAVGSNNLWFSEFREGKTSTKNQGYSDTFLHTFTHPEFKLVVDVSYQDVVLVGPLIFPVIPTLWEHSGNLRMEVIIYTETNTEIDLSQWQVKFDGASHLPEKVYVNGQNDAPIGKVALEKDSQIYVIYPLKAASIDTIEIEFGLVLNGQNSIQVPALNLSKSKGDWHFEQFTL